MFEILHIRNHFRPNVVKAADLWFSTIQHVIFSWYVFVFFNSVFASPKNERTKNFIFYQEINIFWKTIMTDLWGSFFTKISAECSVEGRLFIVIVSWHYYSILNQNGNQLGAYIQTKILTNRAKVLFHLISL